MPGFHLISEISRTLSVQHILVALCPATKAESQIKYLALYPCALGGQQVKFSDYGRGNLQGGLISINGFVEFFLQGEGQNAAFSAESLSSVEEGIYRNTCHLEVKPCSAVYRSSGL